jgi:predicted lipid-binding transport protein (Tim44 family)
MIEIVDILILAAIAGFILFRLWSVLGTRTGGERSPDRRAPDGVRPPAPATPTPANDKGVVTPLRPAPGFPTAAAKGIEEISAVDRSFTAEGFLEGAAAAHERIVEAFAAGDRTELRMLLGDDVYQAFDGAIRERETKGLKASSVFVKSATPQIVWAALKGRSAEIGVRYDTELIQYSKNAAGEIVEGSETAVKRVIDRWTWVRNLKSGDPNWKLEDTDSGD